MSLLNGGSLSRSSMTGFSLELSNVDFPVSITTPTFWVLPKETVTRHATKALQWLLSPPLDLSERVQTRQRRPGQSGASQTKQHCWILGSPDQPVDNSVEKIASETSAATSHIILNFNRSLSSVDNRLIKQLLKVFLWKSIDLYR